MPKTEPIVEEIAKTAAVAVIVSTGLLLLLGKVEKDKPAAPLNAVSHILWGDEAIEKDEASAKYTLLGSLLNAGAIAGWAAIHSLISRKLRPSGASPMASAATGAGVSALAYVTDYFIVPKRLTPGFEKRLSPTSMFVVYATLAASLAFGSKTFLGGTGHENGK